MLTTSFMTSLVIKAVAAFAGEGDFTILRARCRHRARCAMVTLPVSSHDKTVNPARSGRKQRSLSSRCRGRAGGVATHLFVNHSL